MTVPELLSILVPVFNESRTVGSVIDRLMTVDLPVPREIVVINDGSSDGTRQVLGSVMPLYDPADRSRYLAGEQIPTERIIWDRREGEGGRRDRPR
jgi:glycosyltransferase involved in cell wall biosynthesis